MLTLKKLPIIAACAATLIMSCSDDDGSDDKNDPKNSVSAPVVTETAGTWIITDGAVVESDVGIDSVSIALVDGSSKDIELIEAFPLPITIPTQGVKTYDVKTLAAGFAFNSFILKECPDGSSVEAYLAIKGYFKEGSPKEAKSNKITFECIGIPE